MKRSIPQINTIARRPDELVAEQLDRQAIDIAIKVLYEDNRASRANTTHTHVIHTQGRRKMFRVGGAERRRRENRPGGSGVMLPRKIFDF